VYQAKCKECVKCGRLNRYESRRCSKCDGHSCFTMSFQVEYETDEELDGYLAGKDFKHAVVDPNAPVKVETPAGVETPWPTLVPVLAEPISNTFETVPSKIEEPGGLMAINPELLAKLEAGPEFLPPPVDQIQMRVEADDPEEDDEPDFEEDDDSDSDLEDDDDDDDDADDSDADDTGGSGGDW